MYVTKNPKSNNSFFNFSLVLVKHDGKTIGHVVQYERTTYNRYGGSNGWETIQFIPLEGMENYSLEKRDSQLYRDISSYEDMKVEQWFHMGARDGVEEKLFFCKGIKPIKVTLRNVSEDNEEWKKVLGKISLFWNGEESQEVINDDIVINDKFVLFKYEFGACLVTKDKTRSEYISRDVLKESFIITKDDILRILDTSYEEEAPAEEETLDSEEETLDSPRPRRRHRTA